MSFFIPFREKEFSCTLVTFSLSTIFAKNSQNFYFQVQWIIKAFPENSMEDSKDDMCLTFWSLLDSYGEPIEITSCQPRSVDIRQVSVHLLCLGVMMNVHKRVTESNVLTSLKTV